MRLIDADALFAEFENVDWYNNADRDEIAERLVLQAPTIDAVEVVPGEWIEDYNGNGWNDYWDYTCSNCGKRYERADAVLYKANFCPNCGAKMNKESE